MTAPEPRPTLRTAALDPRALRTHTRTWWLRQGCDVQPDQSRPKAVDATEHLDQLHAGTYDRTNRRLFRREPSIQVATGAEEGIGKVLGWARVSAEREARRCVGNLGRKGRSSNQPRAELAGVTQPAPTGMAGTTRREPTPEPPERLEAWGNPSTRKRAEAIARTVKTLESPAAYGGRTNPTDRAQSGSSRRPSDRRSRRALRRSWDRDSESAQSAVQCRSC